MESYRLNRKPCSPLAAVEGILQDREQEEQKRKASPVTADPTPADTRPYQVPIPSPCATASFLTKYSAGSAHPVFIKRSKALATLESLPEEPISTNPESLHQMPRGEMDDCRKGQDAVISRPSAPGPPSPVKTYQGGRPSESGYSDLSEDVLQRANHISLSSAIPVSSPTMKNNNTHNNRGFLKSLLAKFRKPSPSTTTIANDGQGNEEYVTPRKSQGSSALSAVHAPSPRLSDRSPPALKPLAVIASQSAGPQVTGKRLSTGAFAEKSTSSIATTPHRASDANQSASKASSHRAMPYVPSPSPEKRSLGERTIANHRFNPTFLDRYEITEVLGEGGFAFAAAAIPKYNYVGGNEVAVKFIMKGKAYEGV